MNGCMNTQMTDPCTQVKNFITGAMQCHSTAESFFIKHMNKQTTLLCLKFLK